MQDCHVTLMPLSPARRLFLADKLTVEVPGGSSQIAGNQHLDDFPLPLFPNNGIILSVNVHADDTKLASGGARQPQP